ncbi:hypothetical protein DPMN_169467 [Dreissena polymorpha]|uniref:Uncharacterized protein n=1 Tax=Dreissena polymorpha TaxID=45954 RepID=A0A9D4DXF5_DREPO|nr:hypothetical protein DPMN_169467 [Dreissena polymorpha]
MGSGNKTELIERAKGVIAIVRNHSRKYWEVTRKRGHNRSVDKLITPLGEELPDPILFKANWTSSVDEIPKNW